MISSGARSKTKSTLVLRRKRTNMSPTWQGAIEMSNRAQMAAMMIAPSALAMSWVQKSRKGVEGRNNREQVVSGQASIETVVDWQRISIPPHLYWYYYTTRRICFTTTFRRSMCRHPGPAGVFSSRTCAAWSTQESVPPSTARERQRGRRALHS